MCMRVCVLVNSVHIIQCTCSEINVHSTDCTPYAQDTIALSQMGMVV